MASLSGRPLLNTLADQRLFVDRVNELAQVQRALRHGLNILVLGERGSGKTTLLNSLQRRLADDFRRVVFIDAGSASSVQELLRLFAVRLHGDSGRAPPQLGIDSRPLRARELDGLSTMDLLDVLASTAQDLERTVVLVDDLHDVDLAHAMFGRFREELWRLQCSWVAAGDDSNRAAYLTPPADTFFDSIVELEPFGKRDSAELVRRRATSEELAPQAVTTIAALGRGNPRRLVGLARRAVVDGVDPDRIVTAERRRLKRIEALSPGAQRMLEEIEAHGATSASDAQMLERVGLSRQRAQQLLTQLEAADLVRPITQRTSGRPRKLFEPVGGPA